MFVCQIKKKMKDQNSKLLIWQIVVKVFDFWSIIHCFKNIINLSHFFFINYRETLINYDMMAFYMNILFWLLTPSFWRTFIEISYNCQKENILVLFLFELIYLTTNVNKWRKSNEMHSMNAHTAPTFAQGLITLFLET